MRDFKTIFGYELRTQMMKKAAIITTVVMMLIMAILTSLPRIISLFEGDKSGESNTQASAIPGGGYLKGEQAQEELLKSLLGEDAPAYGDRAALEEALENQDINLGLIINPDYSYEVLYQDLPMGDDRSKQLGEILSDLLRQERMEALGISRQEYQEIASINAQGSTTVLGQDSAGNYLIAFVLMLIIYFVVLMYGSTVSSVIAREKDSRTMEILVTSTRPTQLILGKVIAAGVAALVQFGLIILAAYIGIQLNKSTYPDYLVYMLSGSITTSYLLNYLFFSITGFVLYLFLYAALGSTVSKMEDLPSATALVQFLFIAGYILATMAAQMPGSALAVVGSIIPFTSVMVMPLRASMSTVPTGELLIAGALMLATVVFFAFLSIKIYRWGSLNYGNKTKLSRIVKEALRQK